MNDWNNVCVVNTSYALMLYLVYSDEKTIGHTKFVVGDNIVELTNVFENVEYIPDNAVNGRLGHLLLRLKNLLKSNPKDVNIYGQDHLSFSAAVIGNKSYTLIEDGPGVFTIYKQLKNLKFNYCSTNPLHIIRNLLYGYVTERYLGNNPHCTNRIITRYDSESPLLQDKKYTLVDLNILWKESTQAKRNLIMKAFNISHDDLNKLKRPHILFTQPFMVDCGFSEKEERDLYQNIIDKYSDSNSLVIKPHPRDLLDYEKYFPGIPVIKTKAPMQLLGAIGCDYKRAITVSSSSVSCMPSSTEIIWLGTKIDERISRVYGDISKPYNLKN